MSKKGYGTFIIGLFLLIVFAQSSSAAIRYVNVNVVGGLNNGTSWSNAYIDLQSALSVAVSGDEIWVARGTYKPSVEHYYLDEPGGPRYRSFQMINGVGIYGGFSGNETSREQRNPTLHVTILSGDIGAVGDNTDNCYHVFYHPEHVTPFLNSTAILDGFTIRDGYADGPIVANNSERHQQGAGMYMVKSSATIANCIFTNNIATHSGGAIFILSCTVPPDCTDLPLIVTNCTFSNNSVIADSPGPLNVAGGVYTVYTVATFTNCIFTGNTAFSGGGMYHYQSSITFTNCTFSSNNALYGGGGGGFEDCPTSTFINCTFSGNTAQTSGGAILNWLSSPMFTDCSFSGNSTNAGGGSMINDNYSSPTLLRTEFLNNSSIQGGAMINMSDSSPTIINCTFSDNSAQTGGAMVNLPTSYPTIINSTFSGNSATVHSGGAIWNNTDPAIPKIINSTFYANTAAYHGGAIYNYSSNPIVTNSILWGNSAVQAQYAEFANLSSSTPIVTYSDVQGGYSGTGNLNVDPLFVNAGNKDFHLQPTSPCIDRGNNSASNLPTTDFEGDNRIADGNGDGIAVVDMGVDEFVPPRSYLLWTK